LVGNRDEDGRNLGDTNAVGSVSHHSLLSDNCGFLKSRRHTEKARLNVFAIRYFK
jgi:hypothetical protein